MREPSANVNLTNLESSGKYMTSPLFVCDVSIRKRGMRPLCFWLAWTVCLWVRIQFSLNYEAARDSTELEALRSDLGLFDLSNHCENRQVQSVSEPQIFSIFI